MMIVPEDNGRPASTGLRGHRMIDPEKMESRRQEIILAMAAVIVVKDYDSMTLDDVASQMNCSKAVIYYQFRSKEELFVAMSTEALGIACARLEAIIAQFATPEEQLREAVTDLVRLGFEPLHAATLRAGGPSSISDEGRQRMTVLARRYRAMLTDVVARGMESGHLERRDVRLVTNTIINAAQSIFRWVRTDGSVSPEMFIAEVPDMVLGGVFAKGRRD
jgi:AcrR family transcriptional regulator